MRALIGFGLSLFVAFGARRTRTLSARGAVAAAFVGTLAVAAGWSWCLLLLSFFATASALSRLGHRQKMERIGSVIEKSAERDAGQVFANAGVFAAAAIAQIMAPSPVWCAIGAGAVSAAAADTWATEIGTLAGGDPISIVSWRRVTAGTSGGVSYVGSVAGIAGALFIAVTATLANFPVAFTAIALGGIAGALADSVLGGTLQARRWCEVCAATTERRVHDCGRPTRLVGGVAGLDNDSVNTICSAVGALVALSLS